MVGEDGAGDRVGEVVLGQLVPLVGQQLGAPGARRGARRVRAGPARGRASRPPCWPPLAAGAPARQPVATPSWRSRSIALPGGGAGDEVVGDADAGGDLGAGPLAAQVRVGFAAEDLERLAQRRGAAAPRWSGRRRRGGGAARTARPATRRRPARASRRRRCSRGVGRVHARRAARAPAARAPSPAPPTPASCDGRLPRPLGGLHAGRVTVEGEHDPLGVARRRLRRCSTPTAVPQVATALPNPAWCRRHHVGVALADQHRLGADDVGAGLRDPVEHPGLLVERRLGRVEVLRRVEVAVVEARQDPPAEPDHVTARVVDRGR